MPNRTSNLPPLAQRMRPKTLGDIIGQTHLLAKNAPLTNFVQNQHLPSLILHGEAGIGKTTLASVLANQLNRPFIALSAVNAGVKELREALSNPANRTDPSPDLLNDFDPNPTHSTPILFIDEIHRFNKAQQDSLLHAIEIGDITLIGATTENPAFSINNALLSRCQIYRLNPLNDGEIDQLLHRALTQDPILAPLKIQLDNNASQQIAQLANGDARKALNLLEIAIQAQDPTQTPRIIQAEWIAKTAQTSLIRHDKSGDMHYDLISALIKSIRGSDPDAALYWLARLIVSGEPPEFIARRLVILASEDIGLANPNALLMADTALRSVKNIGMPEARIILGQATIYLATSPKSNSSYQAINQAIKLAETDQSPVPLHLRNAPTQLAKQQGHGTDYHYPHNYPKHYHPQSYLPDHLIGIQLYHPADNPKEQSTQEFMAWLKTSPSPPSK